MGSVHDDIGAVEPWRRFRRVTDEITQERAYAAYPR